MYKENASENSLSWTRGGLRAVRWLLRELATDEPYRGSAYRGDSGSPATAEALCLGESLGLRNISGVPDWVRDIKALTDEPDLWG